MLEFLKTAYAVTIPLLLLISLVPGRINRYSMNLVSATNILLIPYSIYLCRQLYGMYQLGKQFASARQTGMETGWKQMVFLLLVILLPYLSLNKKIRASQLFSLMMVVLLYTVFPVFSWNLFDLCIKIPAYFCFLCAAYSLLWLRNQLPYQTQCP